MPRQRRLEYPAARYRLLSRGNQRQDIFLEDVDRHDFIKTLAEACQKTGWPVPACCLMAIPRGAHGVTRPALVKMPALGTSRRIAAP
jgi:hypothetical protein